MTLSPHPHAPPRRHRPRAAVLRRRGRRADATRAAPRRRGRRRAARRRARTTEAHDRPRAGRAGRRPATTCRPSARLACAALDRRARPATPPGSPQAERGRAPRAGARPARLRRDGRPRLARPHPPPLRRGARLGPPQPRGGAHAGSRRSASRPTPSSSSAATTRASPPCSGGSTLRPDLPSYSRASYALELQGDRRAARSRLMRLAVDAGGAGTRGPRVGPRASSACCASAAATCAGAEREMRAALAERPGDARATAGLARVLRRAAATWPAPPSSTRRAIDTVPLPEYPAALAEVDAAPSAGPRRRARRRRPRRRDAAAARRQRLRR